MELNSFQQRPFTYEHPHYISLNVLEISKVNIPLQKEVFIFDIDETLYTDKSHLTNMVSETAIVLSELINVSPQQANELQEKAHNDSGMGIKRLMSEYQLSSQFYMDIHLRLIRHNVLQSDTILKEMLFELKKTKTLICFTNGTEMNSRYVLETLGVSKAFDLVIVNDYTRTSTHKPHKSAFDAVNMGLDLLSEQVEKIVFFDDSLMNCKAAYDAGWEIYHVTPENDLISYLRQFLTANE